MIPTPSGVDDDVEDSDSFGVGDGFGLDIEVKSVTTGREAGEIGEVREVHNATLALPKTLAFDRLGARGV